MGGGIFGKTAARPTSAEFEAVRKYLKNALQPYFGPLDHGDIDTLCGYSGIGWGKVKAKQGRSEGRVGENQGANAVMGPIQKEGGLTAATIGNELHVMVANITIDAASGAPFVTNPTDDLQTPAIDDGPAGATNVVTLPVYAAPDYTYVASNPPTGETLISLLTAAGVADITMDAPTEQLETWCEIVVRHLGATHWLFTGGQMISVAFPIALVHAIMDAQSDGKPSMSDVPKPLPTLFPSDQPTTEFAVNHISETGTFSDLAANSFIQVDIMLMPPEGVAFQQFNFGYSATTLLMSQLVRRASGCRDLILDQNHIELRWTPYPGCPRVEIHITHDVEDLCAYLGLNFDKWKTLVPAVNNDLFEWFADCAEDSRAARGLRRMSKFGVMSDTYEMRYGKYSRMPVLDQFGAWLRERGWSEENPEHHSKEPASADVASAPTEAPGSAETPVTDEGKEMPAADAVHQPQKPKSTKPKLEPVHPDEPRPLPHAHAAQLRIWDKEAEYAAAVAQRREQAADVWRGYQAKKERETEKAAKLEVDTRLKVVAELGEGSPAAEGGVLEGDEGPTPRRRP